MNIIKTLKTIAIIQNRNTSYNELVKFLFEETPPENHNFLGKITPSLITEIIRSDIYENEIKIKENPRIGATACFLISDPFQYYIYKNIYTHLPESEFVIDGQWIRRNVAFWEELLNSFCLFLEKEGVRFRVFHKDCQPELFFENYLVLVSNIRTPVLDLPCNANKKKVRIMYGHSKDIWNFGAWSRIFDLALTYGPYSNKRMKTYVRSTIVGNARFDDWFNGTVNTKIIESLKSKLNPEKKTILYLPTHGNLSSLEFITEGIRELLLRFNVIIRPHQLTLHTEIDRLKKFKNMLKDMPGNDMIMWDNDYTDILHVLAVSDLVISDNSGGIFDTVLADKPLVLLDFLQGSSIDNELKLIKHRLPDLWLIPLTYDKSIEQRIKHEEKIKIGEVVKDPKMLLTAVEQAFLKRNYYRLRRDKVKKMLFSFCDGSSGKRSADVIRNFMSATPKEKTAVAIHTEIEIAARTEYAYGLLKKLKKSAEQYVNLSSFLEENNSINPILFSIVVPTFNRGPLLLQMLESLKKQKNIYYEEFEIILLDDGSDDNTFKIIEGFIKTNPEMKIVAIRLSVNKGPAVARNMGIFHAQGQFVAFTDDDCIIPDDWLFRLKTAFEENPEIAGAGGLLQPKRIFQKDSNIYAKFLAWSRFKYAQKKFKSAIYNPNNMCGDGGNVCYRRSALIRAGGLNDYFRIAGGEDWEFKIRMHELMFPMLYDPDILVEHDKDLIFSQFMKYWLVRGWGTFLTYKTHREFNGFNYTLSGAFKAAVREIQEALFSSDDRIMDKNFSMTVKFISLITIKYASLWIGRYWIPLFIIKKS